jgi:hypothetical protein
MKTAETLRNESYEAGRNYATEILRDPRSYGMTTVSPVDISRQLQSTYAMPDADYRSLVEEHGVAPNPAEYWRGYNRAIQDAIESYTETDQAEMTNRVRPDHDDTTEWCGYGTCNGLPAKAWYYTTAEDQTAVEANGGDWGTVDWWARMDRIDILNPVDPAHVLYTLEVAK